MKKLIAILSLICTYSSFAMNEAVQQSIKASISKSYSMSDISSAIEKTIEAGSAYEEYESCGWACDEAERCIRFRNFKKAYNFCKKSICGFNESEYSKFYTAFVNRSINIYIDYGIVSLYVRDIIIKGKIYGWFKPMGYILRELSHQETNEALIIRYQKEAKFWDLLSES
jgi:hypothetical protein